jgi:hypothetical protein
MKMIEKFGDALSDLGIKVETEAKKATEANSDPTPGSKTDTKSKAGSASKRKPAGAKPK